MKSRVLCVMLFLGLLGSLMGTIISVVPAGATGSAQQVWYINNTRQLVTNPNDNTMNTSLGY